MKKLLAILLSALMLCAMIPFTTVAAAGEPTIVLTIVDELEEVNAGEEFQVEVNLENLDDTAGLISALVEIGFDPDVFELVTTFDEDEEMWMPAIEVGSKYNASSNKYITYGYIDDDGVSKKCLVNYVRGTATASQVRKEAHFYTATFRVKDDAVSGTYELCVKGYNPKNFALYGGGYTEMAIVNTSITVNGSDPLPPSCEHEYENDCDKNCSKCGEESRPEAEHQYFYACEQYCMLCNEKTNPRAKHNILHVEAKAPVSCIEYGNVEYWYCEHCYHAWLDEACTNETNMKRVILAGECISNAPACQDGECINCTLPCYAEAEHEYFNDCESVCINCYEETREATHNVVHVEAVAASCSAMGNIEYWYCDVCGAAWLDADCTRNTNRFAVILPMAEHTYANAFDASCDVCGDERELVVNADEIIRLYGHSITEIKGGLGFKFNADVNGVTFDEEYIADYTNATVTIDGVEYKLITLGAIVNNQQLGNQTMDNVDDKYVQNVEAVKVFEDEGATSYAVRIINIPADELDTEIIARPYFVFECDGEEIVIYGEDQIQSYNGALNG